MPKDKAAKSPFSEIHHLGLIVNDIQKTIQVLSSLGLGPFEPAPMKNLLNRELRGKMVRADTDVWFTKAGHINIEIVHPLEGESLQKETLESKGEGIEHIGFFVDDLWGEVNRLVEKGWHVVTSAKGPNGGGWVFLKTDNSGVYVELVQPWE